MSQVFLSPLPPLCAAMGEHEFPHRLLQRSLPGSGRALNVGLLNLMPNKDVTERQWLRLLLKAEHPHPLRLHLLKLDSWRPTHAKPLYMARYYTTIENALAANQLDMLIVTGAPLGRLDYAAVGYWAELTALMCELEVRAIPTLFSCWAAQAALHHLYQVPTLRRDIKLSGVFAQQLADGSLNRQAATQRTGLLLQTLREYQKAGQAGTTESANACPFSIPHSRFALPDPQTLGQRLGKGLNAVLASPDTGTSVLTDDRKNRLFLLGHPEYEADTLASEYSRDLAQDPSTPAPLYYQSPAIEKRPSRSPGASHSQSAQWQALGALLLRHWLAGGQMMLR